MNPTTPKVVTVNESDLECPLCRDILFEPYTIQKCSHTICGLCVQRKEYKIAYVHGSLEPRQCPFCRVDLGAMPVVYRNLFLAGLCESSYWNLPEHNDKRREKQAEFDRLRAERKRDGEAAKREREQAQRKRSFAEFKDELNKLITNRSDILDPECVKKARTFVREELRMLPIEGPVPPPAAPASIVIEDADIEEMQPPYSDVIVSLMKNSVRTKTLAIARVQSQWYVHGFLDEIERHVPQLQGIKNEVQEIYRAAVTIEQHTQVGLGRSGARSWLRASFPFVRHALAIDHPVLLQTPSDTESMHQRRLATSRSATEAKMTVDVTLVAAEIERDWDYWKRLHSNSWMEGCLNEFMSKFPALMDVLPDDVRDWQPAGQDPGTPAIREQSRRMGHNAAQVIVSKYLRPSGTQQQPA